MQELGCCNAPRLVEIRQLSGSPRTGMAIERCTGCGAGWLHGWNEIAMGGDFEEVLVDTFARVSEDEAARLPDSPTAPDLAFLAERTVLHTQFGEGLRPRRGWPGRA